MRVFLLLFLVMTVIPYQSNAQTGEEGLTYNPEMNFTLAFINFDLTSGLDPELDLPSSFNRILSYSVNYEIVSSNSTYTEAFNAYVDEISTPSWTSALNTTALEEQKESFSRKSIFTKKDGIAIDALLLEQYFVDNPIASSLAEKNHQHIYVLNLSRLDVGEQDHWLNVTEIDPDSHYPRISWRLEWDYDLGDNYNVRFPYAAFSRDSDITILDLTAFQWYLEWRSIWNANVDTSESYLNDLDHLIIGETQAERQQTFDDMTKVWVNDWIKQVYFMDIDPLTSSNLTVQLLVMYDSSQVALNDISWVINQEHMKEAVSQLYESDLEFIVKFVDINTDSVLNSYVESRQISYEKYNPGVPDPFPNWKFYDGNMMWDDLWTDTLDPYYQPVSGTHLKGSILLLDNASFSGNTGWAGGLYTGLGGWLKLTVLYELQRALFDDGSRKTGLSRVIVHEIGHAIGIPHPFSAQFTSDFVVDTMGYYSHSGNYSAILSQQYQRSQSDQWMTECSLMFSSYLALNKLSQESIEEARASHQRAIEMHEQKLYQQAAAIWKETMQIMEERANAVPTEPQVSSTYSPPPISNPSSVSNVDSVSSTPPSSPANPLPSTPSSPASFFLGVVVITILSRIILNKKYKV